MEMSSKQVSVSDLAEYLLSSSKARLIVGIVGAPGAGKSFVGKDLVNHINKDSSSDMAILVPLDGFHFTRHYLDTKMPDPVKARRYRGAHWTFDKDAFTICLKRLKNDDNVDCPEFDHAVHDPEEGKIKVRKNHKIVVIEGLWLFYPPWGLEDQFDVKVLVHATEQTRQSRVVARHVAGGICGGEEAALERYLDNDKPNGDLVLSALPQIDYVIDNNSSKDFSLVGLRRGGCFSGHYYNLPIIIFHMARSSTAVRFGLKVSEMPHRVDISGHSPSCQYVVDLITEAVNMKIQDPMVWGKIESQGIELASARCKFTTTTICAAWIGVNKASFLKQYVGLNDWLDKELSKEDNLHGLSATTLLYIVNCATNDSKWNLAEAAIARLIGKGESLADDKLMSFAESVEKLQESKMSLSDGIMESLAGLLKKRQLGGDKINRMVENPILNTSVEFDEK